MANNELVYEFDSVTDRTTGESKLSFEHHANPVFIAFLLEGRSAKLAYADKPEIGIVTSTVEQIYIFGNAINIKTKNTEYWLKPRIREGV